MLSFIQSTGDFPQWSGFTTSQNDCGTKADI